LGSVDPLRGRLVLIVEDEPVIALDFHEVLRSAGASISRQRRLPLGNLTMVTPPRGRSKRPELHASVM